MQHTIPIQFEDIQFEAHEDALILRFYTYYEAQIPFRALEDIGPFALHKDEKTDDIHSLTFTIESDESFARVQKDVAQEMNGLINQAFTELTHRITHKPVQYLHQNMGIPLIGLLFIGIVDRDTSLIEVKPSTGCNLNCIYCSVDEGTDSQKQMDFVVEEEFMVEQLREHLIEKLTMRGKVNDPIDYEIHIGTHGEPLLYQPLVKLVRDIKDLENDAMIERLGGRIKTISIDTNGVLLNPTRIDALIKAGLNQFNISLNALSDERASTIAGTSYNTKNVSDTVEYIAQHYLAHDISDVRVLLSPIYLSGINEDEIARIVAFIKRLREKYNTTQLLSGIQNFLKYKTGRNPTKELSWKKFYAILSALEENYDVPLRLSVEHFGILDTESIPRPFKRDEVVTDARYLFSGERNDEAVCYARDRLILVRGAKHPKDCKRIKIIRTKHNIFSAVPEK